MISFSSVLIIKTYFLGCATVLCSLFHVTSLTIQTEALIEEKLVLNQSKVFYTFKQTTSRDLVIFPKKLRTESVKIGWEMSESSDYITDYFLPDYF